MRRRGEYGYDAPYAVVIFSAVAVASAVAATICWREGEIRVAMRMTLFFVFFLANTVSFLYTTRRGKFVEWARILDRLQLRGDERVLDMGCGRGAVLTAVARRLTTGRATGIDIWSTPIPNIRKNADRRQAVAEGFRVLKPGGRMLLADIRATATYEDALRTLGASNIERRRLGWRFWWGNPFAATTLLAASKPPA
jgi:arsenite methyltransferase